MKIVNIDAPHELAVKIGHLLIPGFIVEVFRPLEGILYPRRQSMVEVHRYLRETTLPLKPVWKFAIARFYNIAVLLHTIPICLRDSRPEIHEENSIVDLLGAYHSGRQGNSPYIELFLRAIDSSTNNDDVLFRWLFTKVLIHELAHAALDVFNLEQTRSERVSYNTSFGRWREESMANAMALRIIKDYGDGDFYDYAKQFMLSQPPEYALGVLMEGFDHWDFRSVFESKRRGVDSNLQQEWLNYANSTPDMDGLKKWNVLLDSNVVYYFEGKYYSTEEELVYDIVNKVVSDYEFKNGGKMSSVTFRTLFPYIETGAEMSYEPTQKVRGDIRYKKVIELADEDYSLYYSWNYNSFHKFIDKNILNVDLTEYKNR